jgi:hypothetical protein
MFDSVCPGPIWPVQAAVVVVNEYNLQAKALIINHIIPDWRRLPQSP